MKEEQYKEIKIAKEQYNECYRKSNSEIFGLVKDDQNKVHITLGQYVASNKNFDSFEDAEKYISEKPYELIYNLITTILYYEKEMQMANKVAKDSQKN